MTDKDILLHFEQERDPARNLAREEELFRRLEAGTLPEAIRFWVNTDCLVKGRAKSARYGWYNEGLADKLGVPVYERSTGGGVVYHDEGNLNWGLFQRSSGRMTSPTTMFSQASIHIVHALEMLGVRANFAAPNRIDVWGFKVSGMAARSTAKSQLIHGTLLLDSDLEKLNMLCIPPPDCPPVSNLNRWIGNISNELVIEATAEALRKSGLRVRMVDVL